METKLIALTAVFAALAVALSPAFSRIAIPAPFFPNISYQIWEIPIIAVFLLVSRKSGVAITVITGLLLISFFPNIVTFGDFVACLSMLLGIFLASLVLTRVFSKEEGSLGSKVVIVYTAFAVIFRIGVMAVFDYTLLRYPVIGLSLPEPVIIAIIPPIMVFNLTEPLYAVPLGYLIAKALRKNLGIGKKI
jgi:hypothetical protein